MIEGPALHGSRVETTRAHRAAVERIVTLLRQNLSEDLPLEGMAQQAFLSRFHFNRVFRQLTGVPPGQFHSALRLQAAKRLLLSTPMSVFDVCFEVGYKSPSTFVRRFSELVGVSPYQWRNQACAVAARLPALLQAVDGSHGSTGSGPRAQVDAPADFQGLIFAGLFPRAIPQGRPVSCAVLARGGRLVLPAVPDGDYFLFAAALSTVAALSAEGLCGDEMPRSGVRGQRVRVREGRSPGEIELTLRAADPIDPPILLAFPVLALGHAAAGRAPDRRAAALAL